MEYFVDPALLQGTNFNSITCLHEKRHQYGCHAVVAFEGAHIADCVKVVSACQGRLTINGLVFARKILLKLAINRLKQLHNPSCTKLCRKVNWAQTTFFMEKGWRDYHLGTDKHTNMFVTAIMLNWSVLRMEKLVPRPVPFYPCIMRGAART